MATATVLRGVGVDASPMPYEALKEDELVQMNPLAEKYWGRNKKNSEPTRINTALSFFPQTAKEIAVKSGLSEERVQEHLDYWMNENHRGTNVGRVLQKNDAGKYFLGE
ncbi:hypothetical protein C4565_00330 [Candidatus Parcubacteria bacterium]|nr:MAG: hypothetical protein C4565_00330 [Candidatus Parcubacteria bacterium]